MDPTVSTSNVRMETDPVSEMLCSLKSKTKSKNPEILNVMPSHHNPVEVTVDRYSVYMA
jgi:hypothetical protein